MKKYFKPFVILFLLTFFLNFLLHGLVFRGWNDMHLVDIREIQIRPQILVVNYLIQTAGLLFLLVQLKALAEPKRAAAIGGAYGFLMFINLGLSNLFLIKGYPWQMVLTDTMLNMIVLSLASGLTALVSAEIHKVKQI